jgi:hypothetical protein
VPKPAGPLNITMKVNGEMVATGQVPISAPLLFTGRLPRQSGLPSVRRCRLITSTRCRSSSTEPSSGFTCRQVKEFAEATGKAMPQYGTVYSLVREIPTALLTLAHRGGKTYSEGFDLTVAVPGSARTHGGASIADVNQPPHLLSAQQPSETRARRRAQNRFLDAFVIAKCDPIPTFAR